VGEWTTLGKTGQNWAKLGDNLKSEPGGESVPQNPNDCLLTHSNVANEMPTVMIAPIPERRHTISV